MGRGGGGEGALTRGALALMVALVAAGTYANSLGNGFALDDGLLILDNPAVRQMDLQALLGGPWWPQEAAGRGLFRPLNGLGLSLQWQLWGRTPGLFHAVNVVGHALVSVLALLLLLPFMTRGAALAGALLFALHPVHTEAVANVTGQAEIEAAGFLLLACLVYLRAPDDTPGRRVSRGALVGLLYFLALCSKEIAVTLPALLLVLAWLQDEVGRTVDSGGGSLRRLARRVWRELPLFMLLSAALGLFLVLRYAALGSVMGVEAAPSLRGLDHGERILTAVSLWPEYARLLLFPFDLVSDYAPGVLFPAREVTPEVVAGLLLVASVASLAAVVRDRLPHLGAGLLWIAVAVLPVSHLLFPVGVLLGERSLYLPSVGLSLAAGGLAGLTLGAPDRVRWAAAGVGVALAVAFAARVVTRNPAWESDATLFRTLAGEHPESYRAHWLRAAGLAARGADQEAAASYEAALSLNPNHRSLLVEAGAFYGERREWERSEPLLRRTVELAWWRPEPYAHLARQLLLQGRAQEAGVVALEGLARAGADRLLWSLVSEAYIARGRLEAAIRARRAALAVEPGSREDWLRLAQILEYAHLRETER